MEIENINGISLGTQKESGGTKEYLKITSSEFRILWIKFSKKQKKMLISFDLTDKINKIFHNKKCRLFYLKKVEKKTKGLF